MQALSGNMKKAATTSSDGGRSMPNMAMKARVSTMTDARKLVTITTDIRMITHLDLSLDMLIFKDLDLSPDLFIFNDSSTLWIIIAQNTVTQIRTRKLQMAYMIEKVIERELPSVMQAEFVMCLSENTAAQIGIGRPITQQIHSESKLSL